MTSESSFHIREDERRPGKHGEAHEASYDSSRDLCAILLGFSFPSPGASRGTVGEWVPPLTF